MIASLQGIVQQKGNDSIVMVVNGVGFQVFTSKELVEKTAVGERMFLFCQMIVREDAISVYGFESEQEKQYFNHLLGVSGVGPKLALAIVGTLSIDAVNRAISAEQAEIFARVPGVGKKTAQRILIHLQGRIKVEDFPEFASTVSDVDLEVVEALTSLGYSLIDAQAAVQSIPRDAPAELEERIRLALQHFS